jgi:quercetin dioxygenase-like cupin family protein
MPASPKTEVMNLASMIDYSMEAIVSRQITKSEGGNISLFAFDRDQELSEHTTPFDALVQILDGEAEIKISGNKFDLRTGDSIFMPANQPHALRAIKSFKMLLTMIKV